MSSRQAPAPLANRFSGLKLQNVRCFKDAHVALDPRVTVIIGENGAGKTTVAEALASLSAGDGEGLDTFPLRRGAREGSISLHAAEAEEAPVASWSAGARQRLPESAPLFAHGRYRRVQYPEETRPGPVILGPEWDEARDASLEKDLSTAVMGRRTTTLSKPDSHLLRDLGRWIVRLRRLSTAVSSFESAWARLDASVRDLGQGLEGIRVVERGGRDVAVVRRRGLDLELQELSDGYQAILVIVLDLMFRYVFLPPAHESPLDRRALVVIDEIDLHLHPRWQRRVIRQLTRLFRGTQFVVTTHSPAVVQGAIDDGHSVVSLREKAGAVTALALTERQLRALKGAQLGSVLVEKRLFGVASRYSARYEKIEQEVKQLREKVEAGEATAEDRARLLKRLDKLQELVAEEEERQAAGPLLSELARTQIAMLERLSKSDGEAMDDRA